MAARNESSQFRACHKYMARAVKRYGFQICLVALDACRWSVPQKKSRGCPKHYEYQALMLVWLYVQEGIERHRLSVNQFCKKGEFAWYESGPTGFSVSKQITGPTLRRRYQEAVTFLRRETEPYRRLKELKIRSIFQLDGSPVELFWRDELARRLAIRR